MALPKEVRRLLTAGLVIAAASGTTSPGATAQAAAAASGEKGADVPRLEIVATGLKGNGRMRIAALVTSSEIHQVDFLLDGELVEQDRRFPFAALITPPPAPRPGRVEAHAIDESGVIVARDTLTLSGDASSLAVSWAQVQPLAETDWLEVDVDVKHPPGLGIERVDLYRDDRYVATIGASPYRARIPASEDLGFLRAVALAHDGSVAESIHLIGQPGQRETLSVSLIELYAMVTDRSGSPITGLTADSFQLQQGGRPRSIERFVEGDDVPLSIAMVIDSSGSMRDSIERAKRSARNFLDSTLDEGDQALVVTFNARPSLLQPATEDVDDLVASFDKIHSQGGSAVYDAVLFGTLQMDQLSGRKALVVLTDGLDVGSQITATQCAELARLAGVPIFALNLAEGPDLVPSHRALALSRLARSTGGSVYEIRSPEDIEQAYGAIELQLRGQYLLGFSAAGPLSAHEFDTLSLQVSDERLRVKTILGGQVRVEH